MIRKQISTLLYDIIIDFPHELTQLISEYIDILPTKYEFILANPRTVYGSFEIIPDIGRIVIFSEAGYEYKQMDIKNNTVLDHKEVGRISCRVNKNNTNFIICVQNKFYSFNDKLLSIVSNDEYDDADGFVINEKSEPIYIYSSMGICDLKREEIISDHITFVAKIRDKYIVQHDISDYDDGRPDDLHINTFIYDENMENPVEINELVNVEINQIVETKMCFYMICQFENIVFSIKKSSFSDVKSSFSENLVRINLKYHPYGIYHDQIIVDNESTVSILTKDGQYRELYKLPDCDFIQTMRCFDEEIYVLTGKKLFKLGGEVI